MITKTGILKGYKNGLYSQAYILINKPITKEYTLSQFHNDRLDMIENLKYDFTNFSTELLEA